MASAEFCLCLKSGMASDYYQPCNNRTYQPCDNNHQKLAKKVVQHVRLHKIRIYSHALNTSAPNVLYFEILSNNSKLNFVTITNCQDLGYCVI